MNNGAKIFAISLFLLTIFVLGFLTLFKEGTIASDIEYRNLEVRPDYTHERFFSGEYAEVFETYFKDQFAFRIEATKQYYAFQKILKRPEINKMSFGSDGFISKRSNKPVSMYEEELSFVKKNTDFLATYAKKNDIPFFFSLIPEKNYALDFVFPHNAYTSYRDNFISEVPEILDPSIHFHSLLEDFKRDFNEDELKKLFFKTDHHWSGAGAYQGYRYLIKTLQKEVDGIEEPLDAKQLTEFCSPETSYFSGSDNRRVLNLVDSTEEKKCNYEIADRNTYNHFEYDPYSGRTLTDMDMMLHRYLDEDVVTYAGIMTNDHPRIVFHRKEAGNDLRILVTSDSFFNALTSYFPYHFEETHILDLRYFKDSLTEYIEEHDINLILSAHNTNAIASETANYSQEPIPIFNQESSQ